MAKFKVPYHVPNRFDLERFCMNGQVPNPSALRRIADGMNHVTTVQKRQVFAYSTDWDSAPSGSSSDRIVWPVAFRTSRGTTGIIVMAGLVKSDGAGISNPLFRVSVYPLGGGSVVATKDIYFNQRASGATIVPNDVNHQTAVLGGLSPNTEYEVHMTATDGARVVFCSIWESRGAGVLVITGDVAESMVVDIDDDDVCNPGGIAAEADILDSTFSKIVTAQNNLIKQHRTHLLQYSGTDYEQIAASGVSVSGSTSYSDVVNRTFHIDTSKLTTLRRSGSTACPIRLAVRSDRTSGTGTLSVGLYDVDAASIVAEITGIGDDGSTTWSVTAEDLPAQDGHYQIHAKQSNTTTTHIIYGVSAWPYEA